MDPAIDPIDHQIVPVAMLVGKATLDHSSDQSLAQVNRHDLLDASTVKPAGSQFALHEADDVAALAHTPECILDPVCKPVATATNVLGEIHRLQFAQSSCCDRLLEGIVVGRRHAPIDVHTAQQPAVDRSQPFLVDIMAERRLDLMICAGTKVYPQDDLLALHRKAEAALAAAPIASGLAIEQLNFGYAISGDKPAWRPRRAFDDGQKTYIEFPASLATGEAPPLFVIGTDGKAELVNYRQRDRFYIVDRIFDAAELRLGLKKQHVVRIDRGSHPGKRRGA